MRLLRHSSVHLRLALVAIFALVSLIHGPAMAVAAGSPVTIQDAKQVKSHHHDHAAHGIVADLPAEQGQPIDTVCPMLGCSMALGPTTSQPHVTWLAIGRIDARPSLILRAVISEPADPPPRLPV